MTALLTLCRQIKAAARGDDDREQIMWLALFERRAANPSFARQTIGHMMRILRGEIKDSPAMKAALRRAEERARKAWYHVPDESRLVFDEACWSEAVESLERALKSLKMMRRPVEAKRDET